MFIFWWISVCILSLDVRLCYFIGIYCPWPGVYYIWWADYSRRNNTSTSITTGGQHQFRVYLPDSSSRRQPCEAGGVWWLLPSHGDSPLLHLPDTAGRQHTTLVTKNKHGILQNMAFVFQYARKTISKRWCFSSMHDPHRFSNISFCFLLVDKRHAFTFTTQPCIEDCQKD